MFTQIVENRAVWDVGLVQEVQKKIDQEPPGSRHRGAAGVLGGVWSFF